MFEYIINKDFTCDFCLVYASVCSELDILIVRPFLLLDVLSRRALCRVVSRRALCRVVSRRALCRVVFSVDFYHRLVLLDLHLAILGRTPHLLRFSSSSRSTY